MIVIYGEDACWSGRVRTDGTVAVLRLKHLVVLLDRYAVLLEQVSSSLYRWIVVGGTIDLVVLALLFPVGLIVLTPTGISFFLVRGVIRAFRGESTLDCLWGYGNHGYSQGAN
jgi:hypothetical protein